MSTYLTRVIEIRGKSGRWELVYYTTPDGINHCSVTDGAGSYRECLRNSYGDLDLSSRGLPLDVSQDAKVFIGAAACKHGLSYAYLEELDALADLISEYSGAYKGGLVKDMVYAVADACILQEGCRGTEVRISEVWDEYSSGIDDYDSMEWGLLTEIYRIRSLIKENYSYICDADIRVIYYFS